jgi:iron complex transport system ATP-binding protein
LILEIVNGCFSYQPDKPILKNLNFKVDSGEILCILGQNGIGKTTLLRCLTGLLKWQSGYASLNGEKISGIPSLSQIAYVPQAHPAVFPYTALEMVCMGRAKSKGFFELPTKRDREIAMSSLEIVGMQDFTDRKCSHMSGGQLQLVYIARALAGNPEILILDEPESHLDFRNQEIILEKITSLVEKNRLSCLINTHYPEHAMRISGLTLLLGQEGRYVFGDTDIVLNEENIKNYFNIAVKILDLSPLGVCQKAFILDKSSS